MNLGIMKISYKEVRWQSRWPEEEMDFMKVEPWRPACRGRLDRWATFSGKKRTCRVLKTEEFDNENSSWHLLRANRGQQRCFILFNSRASSDAVRLAVVLADIKAQRS